MENTSHILIKTGILAEFTIRKKIRVNPKNVPRNLNPMEVEKFLQSFIYNKISDSNDSDIISIPGMLINDTPITNENIEEQKLIMELTCIASNISKKILEKNLDSYYLCYIINALINMMSLTEKDFNEFHRKFSGNNPDSDPGCDGVV